MRKPVKKIEYKGFTIEIYYDEYLENPRRSSGNLGRMVCFHKKYKIGDEHRFDTPEEALKGILRDLTGSAYEDFDLDLDQLDEMLDDYAVVLPIFLYNHSGLTIRAYSFPCTWDSGKVGFIYISKEKAKEEFPSWTFELSEERAKARLRSEVDAYNNYVNGNVYVFSIPSIENGDDMWGYDYYGRDWETNGLLADAKSMIDAHISRGIAHTTDVVVA